MDVNYTEEQLKSLTPWERSLLNKKPIIAPDGYIPNSVVRRQIQNFRQETKSWQAHEDVYATNGDKATVLDAVQHATEHSYQESTNPEIADIETTTSTAQVDADVKRRSVKERAESVTQAPSTKKLPPLFIGESKPSRSPQVMSVTTADIQREKTALTDNTGHVREQTWRSMITDRPKKQNATDTDVKQQEDVEADVAKKQNSETGVKKQNEKARNNMAERAKKTSNDHTQFLSTEEELPLLEKIHMEYWFPPGVPLNADLILGELIKLIDITDGRVFVRACDCLAQFYQELHLSTDCRNQVIIKLSRRIKSHSAPVRRCALRTLKVLDVSVQEIISFVCQNLFEIKIEEVKDEVINTLIEMIEGSEFKAGLTCLMSSLGISGQVNTKQEQEAVIKAISEHLAARAETLDSCPTEAVKHHAQAMLSVLVIPQVTDGIAGSQTKDGPIHNLQISRGARDLGAERYISKLSLTSDWRTRSKRSERKTHKKIIKYRKKRQQKTSNLKSEKQKLMEAEVNDREDVAQNQPAHSERSDSRPQKDGDDCSTECKINNTQHTDSINEDDNKNYTTNDDSEVNDNMEEVNTDTKSVLLPESESTSRTDSIFAARQPSEGAGHASEDKVIDAATLVRGNPIWQVGESPRLFPPIAHTWKEQSVLPGMTELKLLQSTLQTDKGRTPEYQRDITQGRVSAKTSPLDAVANAELMPLSWRAQEESKTCQDMMPQSLNRPTADLLNWNTTYHRLDRPDMPHTRETRGLHCSFPAIRESAGETLINSSSLQTVRCGAHCQQHKWAIKKMHHYLSISKFLAYTSLSKNMSELTKAGSRKYTNSRV